MKSLRSQTLLAALVVLSPGAALAQPAPATSSVVAPAMVDLDAIDQTARDAYRDDNLAFCKDPDKPLSLRARELCPLAAQLDGCEGLAAACGVEEEQSKSNWLTDLALFLAPAARVLLYVFVAVIVLALLIPIVLNLLERRRRQDVEPTSATPTVLTEPESPEIPLAEALSDAELALRRADECQRRGEYEKALGLYLAASLAALDRRGAIRVARHRTNGEYVRSCSEDAARKPLREIVREVDRVTFGGETPNADSTLRISSAASAIVRTGAALLALLFVGASSAGCKPPRKGADPTGSELPSSVLERNGYDVKALETSLATIPIPTETDELPMVIVDAEKVPLEEETRLHLVRWMESGGTLVVFGVRERDRWTDALAVETAHANTTELRVEAPPPWDEEDDETDIVVTGARVARESAFSWRHEPASARTLATLDKLTYASERAVGKGTFVAIANDDLFTNIGMMPPRNAAALVTILRSDPHTAIGNARRQVRVARAEDGVSPPSNPFSALVAAGLGKGLWHALAAALLLFVAYGVRLARPRVITPRSRRTFAEHVVAMGSFYGRAKAHPHALAAYGRFVEQRLRDTLPRGTDPVTYLATQSGESREHVAALFERAAKASHDDEPTGTELQAIEELRTLAERAAPARSR